MIYTDTLFIVLLFGFWFLTQFLRSWPALREWVIIGFSLAIVASWGIFSVLLLITVAAINFAAVRIADPAGRLQSRGIIACTIAFDLSILALFKYAGFFQSNLEDLLHWRVPVPSMGIPLAISFYTFHLISYLVDITRQRTTPLPVRRYLFYLCFFPHVVAGPIVRTWQLTPQLGRIRRMPLDIPLGIHYFVVGFFLKTVVANNLAEAIDPIWQGDPGPVMSAADRWIIAALYYCQIYSDFAGYSLMALGMARLLGYRLPPNFRAPILAGSLQDFWRRWHRTLSFWLRDYLYIPLGGNRGGRARTVINIIVTMVLGGLWHGAGWNFLVWGAMHGVGIGGERLLGLHTRRLRAWPRIAWWIGTQIWVTVAWVFFRSPDLEYASHFAAGMFRISGLDSLTVQASLALPIVIASGAILHQLTPLWISRVRRERLGLYLGLATGILLVLDVVVYSPNKAFIYFSF
jgi:alginate O-acetyltransferase complex protein AlgI